MVPTLDGSSEIDAHVWSEIGYLIYLRCICLDLQQLKFIFQTKLFSFIRAQRVLSHHLMSVLWYERTDFLTEYLKHT